MINNRKLIHVDTDLGGDPDDVCALVMLLGWPNVELVGITTTIDPGGSRAGCVQHLLRLAGRSDIPVIAGSEVSSTTHRVTTPFIDDVRYWPSDLRAWPAPAGAALGALQRSIELNATVVTIGPLTNLGMLETVRPGALAPATVVAMGGWVEPAADGLPAWGPERDWNLQWDTQAAKTVVTAAGHLTLVTLPATLSARLRRRDLPRLRDAGPLGGLLAQQSETYALDAGMPALGQAHPMLPDDLLNFHYDPVTCAVALGWPGAATETRQLRAEIDGEVLRFVPDASGHQVTVVTKVDGDAFTETWLTAIEAADRAAAR